MRFNLVPVPWTTERRIGLAFHDAWGRASAQADSLWTPACSTYTKICVYSQVISGHLRPRVELAGAARTGTLEVFFRYEVLDFCGLQDDRLTAWFEGTTLLYFAELARLLGEPAFAALPDIALPCVPPDWMLSTEGRDVAEAAELFRRHEAATEVGNSANVTLYCTEGKPQATYVRLCVVGRTLLEFRGMVGERSLPRRSEYRNKKIAVKKSDGRRRELLENGYKEYSGDELINLMLSFSGGRNPETLIGVRYRLEDLLSVEFEERAIGFCDGGSFDIDSGFFQIECRIAPLPIAVQSARKVAPKAAASVGIALDAADV